MRGYMSEVEHTVAKNKVVQPPQPPDLERHYRTTPTKGLILAVIALVVVLALLGLFGERRSTTRQQTAALDVAVEYPTRFRYKQANTVRIVVRNRAEHMLDTLTVTLDPAYIENFSNVSAIPSFARAWEVELYGVQSGETRRVVIELQGQAYGLHEGTVAAIAPGLDTVQVAIKTFVFP